MTMKNTVNQIYILIFNKYIKFSEDFYENLNDEINALNDLENQKESG